MKETLAAEKTAIVENLNKTLAAANCPICVRYFEEPDVIKVWKDGEDALFVACERRISSGIYSI